MKISVSNHITENFETKELTSLEEVAKIATSGVNWSCGVFKDGYRNIANFVSADMIALDIDNDPSSDAKLSLFQAVEAFSKYDHVILTTKSHGKEKHGVVADRYRVIIPLEAPITDAETYYATWQKLKEEFPAIDTKCKDPSRFWAPSLKCAHTKKAGRGVTPVKPAPVEPPPSVAGSAITKGLLSQKTFKFLLHGAKAGGWNEALFKAAVDLHEQGYPKAEALAILALAARKQIGNKGSLDHADLKTVDSAYEREVKYPPRGVENAFNIKPLGDLMREKPTINWLVDGLFSVGGLSLIAGRPKSGKSTITRQLAIAIARGTPFLERPTIKGSVLYLALEEQDAMLYTQFKKVGAKESDDIKLHIGGVLSDGAFDQLYEYAMENKPSLIIVDTLMLLAQLKDSNSYDEVNPAMARFRKLARDTGAHVCCIHHQNKGADGGTSSILGSSAIHGAIDCAMIFSVVGQKRFITTSQRGGTPFYNREVLFSPSTETYVLAEEADGF